jgi:hypothetical protein
VSLTSALTAGGATGVPGNLDVAAKCSADGTVIVGHSGFGGGAYVAVLPECASGSTSFCSTAPNSVDATGAFIGSNGMFDISDNSLVLDAAPVPDQPGIFYFGADQLNGGSGNPFGNGIRCVTGSSVYRLPVTTGTGNVLSFAVDLTSPPASNQITPGSTWYFQAWYRDPAAGGANFNLSDGLCITFCD